MKQNNSRRQFEIVVWRLNIQEHAYKTCSQYLDTRQYIVPLPRLQALLYKADVHKFSKNLEATVKFRRQKGNVKNFHTEGPQA